MAGKLRLTGKHNSSFGNMYVQQRAWQRRPAAGTMRESTRLAAIVVIVILATTLVGASFQMINVRAYMPGLGSLFGSDSLPVSGSGDGGAGSSAGGQSGQSGPYAPSEPPVIATAEPPLPAAEKVKTFTRLSNYPAVLVKGNNFSASGEVLDSDGHKVAGVPVYLYLAAPGSGQASVFCGAGTSTAGGFSVLAAVPAQINTGNYTLQAKAQETNRNLGSEDSADVRVTAQTALSITPPAAATAGEEFPVEVKLVEKATGSPIAGRPVTVSAGLYSATAVTDDRGIARTNASFPSAGDHTILAGFEGSGDYTRSTAALDLFVAPKPGQGLLSQPWSPLLILAGLLLLVTISAAGAWFILKKVRKSPKPDPASGTVPVAGRPLPPPVPGYRIEFADIDASLPAVWGADEALRIRVVTPGGAGDSLELLVDGEAIERTTLTGEAGPIVLQFVKGEHQVTLQAGSAVLAAANLRVVDYREEVVRIFNGLYASLRAKSGGIAEDSTPRELQSAVSAGLSPGQRKGLDQIVSTFEIANYSTHDISREDYVHSFVLIRELQT